MSEHQRSHIHAPTNLPDLATDKLTAFSGSWAFLALHVLWFSAWIIFRVESFPFGLLTMCVSLEAIGLATVVLMSQNRQAARDRLRDDTEAAEVQELYDINKTQLEILRQQSEILGLLKEKPATPRRRP